jgi:predicted RNase H-like HicB family nuclease
VRGDSAIEFVAQIRQRLDGGYRVTFPDLPTVTFDGETLEYARAQAEIALLLHIHRVVAEGAIPESSGADRPYNDALETMTIALTEIDLDDDDGED